MGFMEDFSYERGIIIVLLLVIVLLLIYSSWTANDLQTAILELENRVGILEKLRLK
ncbi:hypothetical protein Ga0123462_0713 [Mariprofundus ferrinatatus]|uniref:Uncharacterized protein n=1 Tax=Mariprofundus ferrinatatus TaxID=1921087 RepID=A0A2K8L2V6_9PROT|nr:hypothetical protein Ga0123462_0713 [Mariprofundus ferrinatatus]